jgi:hypothetical protein
VRPVPDLPLCLGVLKHRAQLARGPIFLPIIFFCHGFLLMWYNFKFEGVLFRSDSSTDLNNMSAIVLSLHFVSKKKMNAVVFNLCFLKMFIIENYFEIIE